MTIFFIGDTHFGHKNIINFEGTKPFRPFATIEEHDEELVRRWNDRVRKHDTVWHLGDFAFGKKNIAIAGRLNGMKKLVLGNHDHYPTAEYLRYFHKVYGTATIEGAILTHVPVHGTQLERFKKNIHGHMHHQRIQTQAAERGEYLPKITVNDWRYINVSAEQINLTPIALEELQLPKDQPDGH